MSKKVDRRDFLKSSGLAAAAMAMSGRACFAQGAAGRSDGPPNIVFIMTDDMGIGDTTVYNRESKVSTPNMEKLAEQGTVFTDAHSPSSMCTPTRYALLTGRYCCCLLYTSPSPRD